MAPDDTDTLRDRRGEDLSYRGLSLEDLRGTDFTGASFAGAVLQAANLSSSVLDDADLTVADLTAATARGTSFRGADLTGADLMMSDLTGADLTGAVLRGACLNGADFRGARMDDVDVSGASFNTATEFPDDFWYGRLPTAAARQLAETLIRDGWSGGLGELLDSACELCGGRGPRRRWRLRPGRCR